MISATKKFEPILAYSETGHFNANISGTPVEFWSKLIGTRISQCRDMPTDSVSDYLSRWRGLLHEPTTNEIGKNSTKSRAEGDITDEEYQELDELVEQAKFEFESQGHRVYSITEDVTNNPEWCALMQQRAADAIFPLYDHAWENFSFIVEFDNYEESVVPNCITTKWIQHDGFNSAFPLVNDIYRPYAGCGPVAAGQVMYYHKYPNTFDWDAMDKTYSTTEAAELLYDIAVRAKYTPKKFTNELNQDYYVAAVYTNDLAEAIRSYGYSAKYNASKSKSQKRIVPLNPYSYPYIIGGDLKRLEAGHAWIISGGRSTQETHYYAYYTLTSYKQIGEFERTDFETYFCDYKYCVWGWISSYDGWYMSLFDPISHEPFVNIETITDIHPIK